MSWVKFRIEHKLDKLGDVSFGILELGDLSFGILKLSWENFGILELGEVNFGIWLELDLDEYVMWALEYWSRVG